MKYFVLILLSIYVLCTQQAKGQQKYRLMNAVTFYDGYKTVADTPATAAGVLRLRNDLYTTKIQHKTIAALGNELQLLVTLKAACDNYDRIGAVNLACVPKGQLQYETGKVQRIELGRFITPFMNKNKIPDSIQYSFNITNITSILKDKSLNQQYDFWVELEVFGVPYAANKEVPGCAGRNDVFIGSLDFITTGKLKMQKNHVLIPVVKGFQLNNYQEGASDVKGSAYKTFEIEVPRMLNNAALYLITSNHGANRGGEEYIRRDHHAYWDGQLQLSYKPGRPSCEPFRQYNTQGNGIYGRNPKTDSAWQAFSNWCPGDVIDTRVISLGSVQPGKHIFKIDVPGAAFKDEQGYIPVSVYLQGSSKN